MKQEKREESGPRTPAKEAGIKEYIDHVEDNIRLVPKAKYIAEKGLGADLLNSQKLRFSKNPNINYRPFQIRLIGYKVPRKLESMKVIVGYRPPPKFDEIPNKETNHGNASLGGEDEGVPNFDLGISPAKDGSQMGPSIPPTSESTKGKGKGNEVADESSEHFKQPQRRTIKLDDHLRSPFVRQCVDLQVNAEDKRLHDWAIANFGGK
ncbi:hypothetical protein L6452_02768 [Arctium lappa]|uniref:Uncharacterized protein n=1 Tax=Arctium lappa TaxID=4217 RepID=A0ACB9FKA9_ARCLA|nr:hypothetical protein L6452_02768 [Arctium lappa]